MSTSDGERSPKRQRLESYSPASPALPVETKALAGLPPQTPPPSVRMSPSWQTQNHQAPGSAPHASSSHATYTTPPGAAGLLKTVARSDGTADGTADSAQHTPRTENGSHLGDVEMPDAKDAADLSKLSANPSRTNHDRQVTFAESGLPPPLSPKALFKLSTTPIAPSRPHASQNLLQVFDLQRIQASVARRDPVTGEKINKLRKSYEGKVKALGLEGRNKAQSNQKELEGLADAGWALPAGDGRTLWDDWHGAFLLGNPTSETDLFAKLDVALQFEPGRLPAKEHEQWKHLLGLDDASVAAVGAKGSLANTGTNTPKSQPVASAIARTAPAVAALASGPNSPKVARPNRTGKKRRYDESSYTGYQDPYDDDGYSTGGLDDARRGAGGKRQKRKDFPSGTNSPAFSPGPGSGSSNMVGVRSS